MNFNFLLVFVASILLLPLHAMPKFHYRHPPYPATERNFRLVRKNRNNNSLQIAPNFTVLE